MPIGAINRRKLDMFRQSIGRQVAGQLAEFDAELSDYKSSETRQAEDVALADAYRIIQTEMAEIGAEVQKDLSRKTAEFRRQFLRRREQLVDSLFDDVRAELLSFTGTDSYRELLLRLCEQFAQDCPHTGTTAFLRAEDLRFGDEILARLPAQSRVAEAADIRLGGIRFSNPDAKLLADETLDTRLAGQRAAFYRRSGLSVASEVNRP